MLQPVRARASFLGMRIDTRSVAWGDVVAMAPLTLRAERGGYAVVFRFGAVCSFGLDPDDQSALLDVVRPHVQGAFELPESEECGIRVSSSDPERLDPDGVLSLHDATVERLQVVAHVLAKSTVLAHHEERVGGAFDRIEALAGALRSGRGGGRSGELQREIADALLVQSQTVGRVEVAEKPEITWDRPDLDRLYERLAREYELDDRDHALQRKLDLVANAASTALDLLHTRRGLRLEWYIVLLILVEIVVILYDMFWGTHAGPAG
jgi:uncharacterized Rmd1/YagE family protein